MRWLAILLLLCGSADAAILFNSNHSAFTTCLAQLSPGSVDTSVFMDMTQPSGQTPAFLGDTQIVAAATDAVATFYRAANDATVNHEPYSIISQSSALYTIAIDRSLYANLVANNVLYTRADVNTAQPVGEQPPTAMSVTTYCEATNETWGQEYCVPQAFTVAHSGCLTDSPSSTTSTLSQIEASMKLAAPSFTMFDIKAALRQTAANWSTGYSHLAKGYGAINYTAASAIGSAASLYLQPPGVAVSVNNAIATFTLYPFRQTRRVREELYSVSAAYVWPVKNEYTTTDIAASGGTLLYTSNGTDMTPVYAYHTAAGGTLTVV